VLTLVFEIHSGVVSQWSDTHIRRPVQLGIMSTEGTSSAEFLKNSLSYTRQRREETLGHPRSNQAYKVTIDSRGSNQPIPPRSETAMSLISIIEQGKQRRNGYDGSATNLTSLTLLFEPFIQDVSTSQTNRHAARG
jgi:hypothetical protein